jgi:hypothetical protein
MELSSLRTLGRSGLLVSPLALGAMTFGNKAWGSPDDVSRALFNAYIDAGGNFVDTADVYSGGRSEELLGSFIAERKLPDRVVLATKYSFSGGNGRKNLYRALRGATRTARAGERTWGAWQLLLALWRPGEPRHFQRSQSRGLVDSTALGSACPPMGHIVHLPRRVGVRRCRPNPK